ncbi:Glucuronoxylan 4-O-methyltransferase 2, partial [Mucuna pruriens]
MPPDVIHFRPPLAPLLQFSHGKQRSSHRFRQGMNLTKRKLILILLLILSIISILRILSLSLRTSSVMSPPFSTHNKVASHTPESSKHPTTHPNFTLTEKEFKVLSNLVALKSPCNLLIFGFQPQYLTLSSMNAEGSTIFLDDHDMIDKVTRNFNNTRAYKLGYNVAAKKAYNLLKHARKNQACAPNPTLLQKSKCKLALRNLPAQVYEKKWDVIVVDGPRGDSPESPGRMGPIYTASVLARAGNVSDVLVHDVDRMIEKWFSWEFLCHENLLEIVALQDQSSLQFNNVLPCLNSYYYRPVTLAQIIIVGFEPTPFRTRTLIWRLRPTRPSPRTSYHNRTINVSQNQMSEYINRTDKFECKNYSITINFLSS